MVSERYHTSCPMCLDEQQQLPPPVAVVPSAQPRLNCGVVIERLRQLLNSPDLGRQLDQVRAIILTV